MARRINGAEGDALVIGGVIIAGYFLVLKPLMGFLGGSPEDNQNINNQQSLQPADNIFSPQYQDFADNFASNPSYNTDGSLMTMQQYYAAIKSANDNGSPILLNGVNIAQLAENLRNALSVWHLTTDPAEVNAVFSSISQKTQVSSIAAYLYYNYNQDLLTMLKGSLFKTGLSPSDLSALITKLNNLPD